MWRWSRGVLLTFAAALTFAALRVAQVHDALLPGEVFWVGGMAALLVGLAWLPRPVWWTVGFAVTFVSFDAVTPPDHYGAAWLAAYAVCVDANSRRPAWLGPALVGLLVVSEVAFGGSIRDAAYNALYLALAAGLGQFIRAAFAFSRRYARTAELERRVELMTIAQDVHDSGTSRLAQVVFIARGVLAREKLSERGRSDMTLLIDRASSAASDLRRAALPAGLGIAEPSAPFAEEWRRSREVLRGAGLVVSGSEEPPRLVPGPVSDAAARIVTEATSNICKHAAPGGRVEAEATLRSGMLALEWRNEARDERGESETGSGGLGLSGMGSRVAALGGTMSTTRSAAEFRLRVEIPVEDEDE